jgi:capsular polysaccharide biosynthesis protein
MMNDVELIGPNALAIDSQNRYILECSEGSSHQLSKNVLSTMRSGYLPIRLGARSRLTQAIATLVGPWAKNFYHWFCDYLPKIRGAKKYANKTGTEPKFLIPQNPQDWILDSLKIFGISDENIITWSGDRVQIDRLVIPSIPRFTESDSPSWGYCPSPAALEYVSQRMRGSVGAEQANERRILITRRGASERCLQNESEVIESLSSYGFEPVNLSQIRLKNQIKLFAEAEMVVSPHGAGLTNMIHAKNANIIELFGEYVNACYYCLANGLGFSYKYQMCKSNNNNNIKVETESLTKMIDSMA